MNSPSLSLRQRPSKSQNGHDVHKGYQLLEPRQLLAGDVCFATELVWSELPDTVARSAGDQTHIRATQLDFFDLHEESILSLLDEAPLESAKGLAADAVTLSIPTPDGAFESFAIVESPILEPELAARFSGIKTYRGQGIDNPASTIRLDYTDLGFHAQVLAPNNGDYFIDPFIHLQTDVYASYYVHDTLAQPETRFTELGVEVNGRLVNGHFHGDVFHFGDHVHDHDVDDGLDLSDYQDQQ